MIVVDALMSIQYQGISKEDTDRVGSPTRATYTILSGIYIVRTEHYIQHIPLYHDPALNNDLCFKPPI